MLKITDLEPQKKNANRINVYINDRFYAGVSDYIAQKYLKIGMVVTKEQLEKIVLEEELEKAKGYVANYLLSKTEKIIRDKLKEKGYAEVVIEETISFLHRYNYISDERYAKALANDSVKFKKQGKQKIKMKLRQKGVNEEDIEKALSEVDEQDELEAIEKLLVTKKPYYEKRSKNQFELKGKLFQFLMGRGFSTDTIKKVLDDHF